MKSSALLAITILLAASPFRFAAADEKPVYWYSVEYENGYKTITMYGSSPLDEAAFAKQLEGTAFIRLDDLIYLTQNRVPKNWSEWTKFQVPRIYINPKDIIDFFPLVGDPRTIAAAAK